jgi:tetratricopeptide (TPR) repeat protein
MALEAHRRKPQNPGHLTVAGIAHYRLGELREAIAMLERAQELNAWARYPLHHAMNTLYLGVCREQLDARE